MVMIILMIMKIIFLDTEFTGEHSKTTLVSAGFVTLDNKKLKDLSYKL